MAGLPITRMTLYKHGVGFFERRASLEGEAVSLTFRIEEMNDILKSLTAVDWGEGQVLGVDYATPQSQAEQLAGCSIHLEDDRSLRDLLVGLRGRLVALTLDQDETAVGLLVGLDELTERQPVGSSLVSLLDEAAAQVHTFPLGRVQGVEIRDERGEADLRFFLRVTQTQENYRTVTIRLTPGSHDLAVSYIAPAPTWRVSYRLVADPEAEGGPQALLLGWGIFDNRLEEDLTQISLSLVAGMPISFVYDLYTPFTPQRPFVQEESRVAPGPVELAAQMRAMPQAEEAGAFAAMAPPAAPAPMAARSARKMSRQDMADSVAVSASGQAMGELFQYHITTPVSVGRGQSAMAPIVSTTLAYQKSLIYNSAKLPAHPVASLRLENGTGLTLERGPVTVIEGGDYVGEAVLPFTVEGAEFLIPYAVELGVRVQEQDGSRMETYGLSLQGAYLLYEEWEIRWREYQLNNTTPKPCTVLVEHLRSAHFDLFDTPQPVEMTETTMRFAVEVAAHTAVTLRVNTRRQRQRREEVQRQSYSQLQHFLRQGLIDRHTHDRIAELLSLLEQMAQLEKRLQVIEQERQKVYEAQRQIQGNMQALSPEGKEGQLRAQYVARLGETETGLSKLATEEETLKAEGLRLLEAFNGRLAE